MKPFLDKVSCNADKTERDWEGSERSGLLNVLTLFLIIRRDGNKLTDGAWVLLKCT